MKFGWELLLRYSVVFCFVSGCRYQCNRLPGKTHLQYDALCVEWDVKNSNPLSQPLPGIQKVTLVPAWSHNQASVDDVCGATSLNGHPPSRQHLPHPSAMSQCDFR